MPGSPSNTVIGSLQTGGSSGGPWVVNLGVTPSLNGATYAGTNRGPQHRGRRHQLGLY